MLKSEILKVLAKRIFPGLYAASTWTDLVSAIQVLTQVEKDVLVQKLITRDSAQVGVFLMKALEDFHRAQALTIATTDLADDQLSILELEKYLNG